MKRKCVVPGCHNHSDNVKSLMFHIFPADDTLRQIWVDWIHSLPADEDYEMPEDFEDSYICGVHFGPEDDYGEGDDLEEKIPSIHLAPAAAASARASEPTTAEEDNTRDTMNNFNDNNGETEGEAEQTEPEADQTEPEPDTEGEGARSEIPDDGSDEDDELPLQARIKAESGISDYEPDEDMEDDDSDPSFDPSDPRTSTIKPVTGGRGRKSTARYSEPAPAPKKRGRKPKAQTPEPKEPKRNKRKSQPKKVTKRPTKRELKMREIEYDTDEAADEENNQNRSNKQSGGGSGQPEIPESITLALNSSNSRIVGLTEEIENCHRIIKEKNELINKLNLNNNELSSKLKYFTQSEFSIKLTSVITEASKGDTRAVYLLDQIRKYNSVAASNTVYVALPSTSAALSTAAAQSVIQEQIQQQQQQQQQAHQQAQQQNHHQQHLHHHHHHPNMETMPVVTSAL
uniref:THAP-type domain-containing protein n=1 Tax=Cacopsylla melanoneura TaxID=428564 RepID=A0A8D8RLW0_9HEMI